MVDAAIYTFKIVCFVVLLQIVVKLVVHALNIFVASTISPKAAWFVANYLTFVGVVHHELCHAIVAFITGAKIKSIDLFKPTETSLGSVAYIPRGNKVLQSLQNSLSSIAPTVLGILNCILAYKFLLVKITEGWQIILFWYCWISVLMHTPMSKPDIKSAKSGLILTVIILFIAVLIMQLAHGN